MRDLGQEIKTGLAIAPIDGTAATLTGAEIDAKGFESAVFTLMTGVASGAPTAQSITWKVQDCATSGGSFADVSVTAKDGSTTTYAGTEIVGDGSAAQDEELNVNLMHLKRYVKIVAVLSFTSGSTPKQDVCVSYALGEAKINPN